jgi:hypothetical protein
MLQVGFEVRAAEASQSVLGSHVYADRPSGAAVGLSCSIEKRIARPIPLVRTRVEQGDERAKRSGGGKFWPVELVSTPLERNHIR